MLSCQASNLSKRTLTPQEFAWFLMSATNETHAGYDGMAILLLFGYHSWLWPSFALPNPSSHYEGGVYRVTTRIWKSGNWLLELGLSTIPIQFQFTPHIDRLQYKVIIWVYFPRHICTTKWLQLTQRNNSGRSRDWPESKESFGSASQWDWTLIRCMALVWHKSIFIWTNTTPSTGISQQIYPSSKRFLHSGGPAPLAWDMPWQVIECSKRLVAH